MNINLASSAQRGPARALLPALVILLLTCAGCASRVEAQSGNPAAAATPTAGTPTPSPSPSVPPNAAPPAQSIPPGFPPAKASLLAEEDQLRLKNSGQPMVSASFPAIQGSLIQGIFVGGQDPQLRDQFSITNSWAGPGLGAWETVDAGSIPAAPGEGLTDHGNDQAAVFVFTESTDPNSAAPRDLRGAFVPTQHPVGQLTIVSEDNNVLTLSVSSSAAIYHFDLATLSFN